MRARAPRYPVVVVPFPFTDQATAKRRPALVLSSAAAFDHVIGHSVMAMITSARNSAWPLDVGIRDLREAGLPSPSVVRMKLFTIDHRLILSTLGKLSERDSAAVSEALQRLLGIPPASR